MGGSQREATGNKLLNEEAWEGDEVKGGRGVGEKVDTHAIKVFHKVERRF